MLRIKEVSSKLASEHDRENKSSKSGWNNLKLSDKIWVGLVIAAFVIAFLLIVIYDVI